MLQEFVELKVQQFGVHAINLWRRAKVGLARGEGCGGGGVCWWGGGGGGGGGGEGGGGGGDWSVRTET